VLTLGVATVLTAACSGSSETQEPEAKPPPSASPETSPSPSPSDRWSFSEEIEDVDNLGRFCGYREGEAYEDAAEYSGDGPHALAVNLSEKKTNAAVGASTFEILTHEPFSDWLPDEPTDAHLLACVKGVPGDAPIGTCEYHESVTSLGPADYTLDLYEQTFTVTVYELKTARVVAETTIETAPDCPVGIDYYRFEEYEPSAVYTRVSKSEVADYVADFVNTPAR
jgi:hypothetical protein